MENRPGLGGTGRANKLQKSGGARKGGDDSNPSDLEPSRARIPEISEKNFPGSQWCDVRNGEVLARKKVKNEQLSRAKNSIYGSKMAHQLMVAECGGTRSLFGRVGRVSCHNLRTIDAGDCCDGGAECDDRARQGVRKVENNECTT